ncbi:uncharacterized protein TNCV_1370961 [Trichonephila clavipes]|nr:uncharacterized protein TNCV_1370961 [Trichonephila clavipes]
MAALVSEYTLEFFTLLNARSKKELIEWCMKEGLIASSYECPKCNEQMGLNERKSVVLDGFEWRCRKKVFTLADGAKQSFSLRGKNRLRIFTLRLTGGAHRYHCSRRKQKPTSDINKALTGGAKRTTLNQSPGYQSRGFSTADSHWLGTRACAVLAISLRCQSVFRYFTERFEIFTFREREREAWRVGCHLSRPPRHLHKFQITRSMSVEFVTIQ